MTKVVLISDDTQLKSAFRPISKTKKFRFEHISWAQWHERNTESNNQLFYFDIAGFTEGELKRQLAKAGQLHSPWGIVDNSGRIEDVAHLFHQGGCDYIDTNRHGTVKVRRIQQVLDYHQQRTLAETPETEQARRPKERSAPPAKDWKSVVPGQEYTFCIMYIELLPSKEWSKKSGANHQEQMQTAFHDLIESRIGPHQGRIWMWNEWGGLVLFPHDGKKTNAVVLATRLLLNRVIMSIEGGPFKTLIDFKIALHLGVTPYQERGNTGTIVSDDVNFIFHLGTKYAEPNRLYLTAQVRDAIDTDLKQLLEADGDFEDKSLYILDSPFSY